MISQAYLHSNEVAILSFFHCLPPAFDCILRAKLRRQLAHQSKPQRRNRHPHVPRIQSPATRYFF